MFINKMNLKGNYRLFIELLQVSIGNRVSICKTPTEEEWGAVYAIAQRYSLTGITFYGVDMLGKQGIKPPPDLIFSWLGISEQIKVYHTGLRKRGEELIKLLSEKGIRASILKGQGLASYYNDNLKDLRLSGDIDVFVDCGFKKAIKTAKDISCEDVKWDYRHAHVRYNDGIKVEIHYRPEMLLNLYRNRRLQKWFVKNQELLYKDREGLVSPSLSMNVFYVLMHIYRHYLFEGIGLKQLLDYYFVLKNAEGRFENYADNESIIDVLNSFGMLKFTGGVMWMMRELFILDHKYMICEPIESEGYFILKNILTRKSPPTSYLCRHYTSEMIWTPIWIVWHKLWKIQANLKLK